MNWRIFMRLQGRYLTISNLTEFIDENFNRKLDETKFEILRLVIYDFGSQRLIKLKCFRL